MAFSKALRKLREQKKLTQKDVAKHIGITRQAIAFYELGKREPDYNTLKRLADYFGVSIDYLLGRASNDVKSTQRIGMNIKLIRGNLTFKELSDNINKKTGSSIQPEMLELYEKGERTPFAGTIKVLAMYANVSDDFFYRHNTIESYNICKMLNENRAALSQCLDRELLEWVLDEKHLKYIELAKEICEADLPVEIFKPLVDGIKKSINK
ncbi:MAG: helix-turn-helix domain-containing protein [Acetivibrionales bacterium]